MPPAIKALKHINHIAQRGDCRRAPPKSRNIVRPGAEGEEERERTLEEELELNKEKRGVRMDDPALKEQFAVQQAGEAECSSCGYVYTPNEGDMNYPVLKGTAFQELPQDWRCPTCGAEKQFFQSRAKKVAGFEQNQGYGLGGNSLTSDQKSLLIYGTLTLLFGLFISGYFLQ